jgi:DNA-binding XRE family transcriptional regulator
MPVSLYDRLIALPRPDPDTPALPPAEIIAFNVHVRRKLHGWKQSALASLAGVSLSTVERIERGDTVQPAVMEKIGAAFGYPPGYYTAPRVPLTQEEMAREADVHTAFVPVTAFANQHSFRRIARCQRLAFAPIGGLAVNHPLMLPLFERMWDLSVHLERQGSVPKSQLAGVRDLYRDIARHLTALHREGIEVLGGVLHEPERDPAHYGVIAAGRRSVDPGILARKLILLDRREVTGVWGEA